MTIITLADARRHVPEHDAHTSWQESFFLGWYDAATRTGGHHHISLKVKQGSAHVWSWLIAEGKLAGRSQLHVLPLPDGDYDDLAIGSLHLTQGGDLTQLRLEAIFDTAHLVLDYQALCHPLEIGLNTGGITVGKRHYESMGHVRGTARVGDREIQVFGGAWQDHSWGPRQFYAHRAGRWLFAVFGNDLAISAFTYAAPLGQMQFGWVFDHGVVSLVTHARFRACVDDDGISPLGCDAVIGTATRDYGVKGWVDASAITGDQEWYSKDGLARFECDGLPGHGILEVNELKSLPPSLLRELAL